MSKFRTNSSWIIPAIALLIVIFNLGKALFLFLRHMIMAISFPFPLEYGEGLVLDQIIHLASRVNIYRNTIATPPYTVTNSPPLYMLIQVPFDWIFGPAFWYGRIISVISLVFIAIFLSLTLYNLTKDWMASAISGLLLFSIPYFWNWSVLDRADSLALALSWAGLYTAIRWPDRQRRLIISMILFTAAIFTQPTNALVAPITAMVWLLISHHTRQSMVLFAGTGGFCLALYLIINILTKGGFYLNLITYNPNIWNFQEVTGRFIETSFNSLVLGLIAVFFLVAEQVGTRSQAWPFVLTYFIIAGVITFLIGKAGPNDGYMFELSIALCLTTGAALAWVKNHLAKAAIWVLIAIQINSYTTWTIEQYLPSFNERIADRDEIAQLAKKVLQASDPILIDEYNGLLPLAGKSLYYQPFEFAQLTRAGLWNPTPLINDIAKKRFSMLMIYFPRDLTITNSRWPENIYASFWENYMNTDDLASTLVCLPQK